MQGRRAVILKRAEQREQRVELQGERFLEMCERMGLLDPPRPPSESRDGSVEYQREKSLERHRPDRSYRGDFYYKRSYAERFPHQAARSSKEQSGDQRKYLKIKEPVSPDGIRKAARRIEENSPEALHNLIESQKLFEWKDGERQLYAERILKDLDLKPRYYCPI